MPRLPACLSLALSVLLSLLSLSHASQVQLHWEAPTLSADGTPLTDLAGYAVYYWQEAWDIPVRQDAGVHTSVTVSDLRAGATYHFAVTAYDTSGNESGFSPEVVVTLPVPVVDTDGDGLTDEEEATIYGTDPTRADTDGDGLTDGAEVAFWGAAWGADADGDGVPNLLDADADNDGFTDGEEQQAGTDPADADSRLYTVQLHWEAPTLSADGTPLTDLAGYAVYYWQEAWDIPVRQDAGMQTSVTVSGLPAGSTYHFAVTAYDTSGNESGFSPQVTLTVAAPAVDTDGDGLTDEEEATIYGTDPTRADTDGDGLDDGAEVAFWGAAWEADADGDGVPNLLDADADNDGFTDGEELQAGTDPADAASHPLPPPPSLPFALEAGEVVADSTWQYIPLQQSFIDPVVVMTGMQVFGADPAVARLRQVGQDGFEVRLQEWVNTDGVAPLATVGYLVVERGVHVLDNGTLLQADRFLADGTSWIDVPFQIAFGSLPVVLAATTTSADMEPVTCRLDSIQVNQFRFRLQEAEAADQQHGLETVTYIAWEPGKGRLGPFAYEVGTTSTNQKWRTVLFATPFNQTPVVLTGMQTTKGGDTATVQWRDRDLLGVDVQVAEEQSHDRDLRHAKETIGYLAIEPTVD